MCSLHCHFFFLVGGANGTGTGTVTALKTFWRDVQKYYYLPIIMSDMRDRETNERNVGTSTLTIEIGDTNNHEHKPGHKEIFVYKYDFKGMLISYMPHISNSICICL